MCAEIRAGLLPLWSDIWEIDRYSLTQSASEEESEAE